MDEIEDTKPPHRGLKKGLFVIPTLFTAGNVAMGFLAVLWSVRGFHAAMTEPGSAPQYFDQAAVALGLAILFDTMDGRVARATRTTTEIGVQFDSLADVLTFGIAPTALIYCWAIAPDLSREQPALQYRRHPVIHLSDVRCVPPGEIQSAGDAAARARGRSR